eukprot:XP_001704263.1 Hypothetical protein GL50803_27472 [Giardia lamblia ATCC 50803]
MSVASDRRHCQLQAFSRLLYRLGGGSMRFFFCHQNGMTSEPRFPDFR